MRAPDLARAFSLARSSAFLRVAGRLVGWRPKPRDTRRFDEAYYLAKNEDVARAGIDPLDHYLTYGRREGRPGSRADEAGAARIRRFDSAFYIDRYPDVAKIGADPLSHFVDRGLREGRLGSLVDSLRLEAEEPAWQPSHDRLCLNASGSLARESNESPSWAFKPVRADGAPNVSIVVIAQGIGPAALVEGINSIIDQSCSDWEIMLLHSDGEEAFGGFAPEDFGLLDPRIDVSMLPLGSFLASETNSAVARANGSVLVLVEGGNALEPHALHHFVTAMRAEKQACICYGDEIFVDADGTEVDQDFKPDFSPEYLESGMYLPPCLAMPRSFFLEIGGCRENLAGSELFDLMLRASASKMAIVHIPHVLSRRRVGHSKRHAEPSRASSLQALSDHLKASGRDGTVGSGLIDDTYRVRDAIPPRLPVTLVIFTDNRSASLGERGNINLYDNFLDSILRVTETGCRYRVLAVDNGNLTSSQHECTEKTGGRVISFEQQPGESFNFARKANFGLAHVETEMVVLLNDDMEVLAPGWLDALMELAVRPPIGAVGAKLLFPGGTVQHCGVVAGILDDVGHVYHRQPASWIGPHGDTHRIRNYSAVTGACLASRMSVLREVGGLDERFEIDYNDIDLCFRLREAGYRIACMPFAELVYFEGRTEQRSCSRPADQKLFRERWKNYIARDPCYHPNLTRRRLDFTPA